MAERIIKFQSIKKKIFITILLCFLIPFIFQTVTVTTLVNSLFEDKVIKMAQINIEKSALNVSSIIQAQFDMTWFFKKDELVADAIQQMGMTSEKDLLALQRSISNRFNKENNIERFSYPFYFIILDYNGNMMTNYTYSPHARYNEKYNAFTQHEWYIKLKSEITESAIIFSDIDFLSSYGPRRLYVAMNVIKEENKGILIIAVDEKAVTGKLSSSLPLETSFIVSDNGYCILYSGEKSLKYTRELFDRYLSIEDQMGRGELVSVKLGSSDNISYMIMSHKIVIMGYAQNWRIISLAPLSKVTFELSQIKYTNILVLVFYLCAIIWVIFLLNRNIVKPIVAIRNVVNEVTSGNLNTKADEYPYNEFGDLGKGFNSMVKNINESFNNISKQEQLKRKTEILLLQNQIKPHFVRNVLNTIRWLAEINGVTSVSKSIIALSGMLEYNFKDSKVLSTVNDELIYVKKYSYLQKLRFQNKYKDEYTVQEEILDYPLLKLSLQPIIENSIYHGILKKEGLCTISISGRKVDDHLELTVSDDGVGMSQDILDYILMPKESDINETSKYSENIALWNIDQRIKKQYGLNYGLYIKSTIGQGTDVLIKFPILEVAEGDDKNTNC